jgi:hypothetical protein
MVMSFRDTLPFALKMCCINQCLPWQHPAELCSSIMLLPARSLYLQTLDEITTHQRGYLKHGPSMMAPDPTRARKRERKREQEEVASKEDEPLQHQKSRTWIHKSKLFHTKQCRNTSNVLSYQLQNEYSALLPFSHLNWALGTFPDALRRLMIIKAHSCFLAAFGSAAAVASADRRTFHCQYMSLS